MPVLGIDMRQGLSGSSPRTDDNYEDDAKDQKDDESVYDKVERGMELI